MIKALVSEDIIYNEFALYFYFFLYLWIKDGEDKESIFVNNNSFNTFDLIHGVRSLPDKTIFWYIWKIWEELWVKFIVVPDKNLDENSSLLDFWYEKDSYSLDEFVLEALNEDCWWEVAITIESLSNTKKSTLLELLLEKIDESILDFMNEGSKIIVWKKLYKKQREIFIDTIYTALEVVQNKKILLTWKIFLKKWIDSMFPILIFFWRLWHLEIEEFTVYDYNDDELNANIVIDWKVLHNDRMIICVNDSFIGILESYGKIKDFILDKIFDEEYKKISILRKGWKFHMIEWEKEIYGGETRFIELQKKYPYSEINAKNHKGKINKYTVTEKIKLNPDNQ